MINTGRPPEGSWGLVTFSVVMQKLPNSSDIPSVLLNCHHDTAAALDALNLVRKMSTLTTAGSDLGKGVELSIDQSARLAQEFRPVWANQLANQLESGMTACCDYTSSTLVTLLRLVQEGFLWCA